MFRSSYTFCSTTSGGGGPTDRVSLGVELVDSLSQEPSAPADIDAEV